jgi:hypothetical protein
VNGNTFLSYVHETHLFRKCFRCTYKDLPDEFYTAMSLTLFRNEHCTMLSSCLNTIVLCNQPGITGKLCFIFYIKKSLALHGGIDKIGVGLFTFCVTTLVNIPLLQQIPEKINIKEEIFG